ncbi:MAG: electron transfer flavoprotein subunit alpha/FixB family protein [Renibacterium salmoninarum]|nr:electron transfer flavoprotein subunit alpha/FixB family protein [Renibacterium salmoninarum]
MRNIVVFIDQPGSALGKAGKELLTFARGLGAPVAAVAGELSEAVRAELGEYGVAQVLNSNQAELFEYSIVPKAEFLAVAAQRVDAQLVLTGNSAEHKEIAARLAVLLDAGVISDAVGVVADADAGIQVEKLVLAGSYTVSASVRSAIGIVALKANGVEPEAAGSSSAAAVETVDVPFSELALRARIASRQARPASGRPELSEARIVVAGGRGIDGDFGPVEELADLLGAAVGASRAATDAGWIDHSAQVGQTGKTVSPQLYISVGISGAIQQKAGMQTSKFIVAVNQDAESPVFEIADLGIVGDLFTVLPQAIEEIKRRRA